MAKKTTAKETQQIDLTGKDILVVRERYIVIGPSDRFPGKLRLVSTRAKIGDPKGEMFLTYEEVEKYIADSTAQRIVRPQRNGTGVYVQH